MKMLFMGNPGGRTKTRKSWLANAQKINRYIGGHKTESKVFPKGGVGCDCEKQMFWTDRNATTLSLKHVTPHALC